MNAGEERVAKLVANGLSTVEIACELGISSRTVKDRKRRAAQSMGYNGKRLDVFLVCLVYGMIPSQSRLERFELRMRRTAELVARGMTDQEIAESRGISPASVRNHLREIFDVAGVWNRRELGSFLLADRETAFNERRTVADDHQ